MSGQRPIVRAMCIALIALLAFVRPVHAEFETLEPDGAPRATVVLLHGLNRSSGAMSTMAHALQSAGFRAVNVGYPSAWHDVPALSRYLDRDLRACCREALIEGVHFVTHSMGGVLLRFWSAEHAEATVARSVMLSPPNQGSELVDELRDTAVFKLVTGPAGQQLGTDDDSLPRRLGPVTFELGVITGRATLNPVYSWLIPGDDDGKVAVSRARVQGMTDFLVVDVSHSFIMNDPLVIEQTVRFLNEGRFQHGVAQ